MTQPLPAPFENARWISRAVPASTRTIRALPGHTVHWAAAGETLGQPFDSTGPVIGLNLDLVFGEGASPVGRIQLVDASGAVVAEAVIADYGFPPDRLAAFLPLAEPARPGSYEARLVVESGEIGWRAGDGDRTTGPSLPLPITAPHLRSGVPGIGSLAVGVELPPAPNPEFSRMFELEAVPAGAVLHLSGLGSAITWINGARVGDAVLEPAQTQYDRRVGYTSHPVSSLLRPGRNEIVVATGRGFWSVRGTNVWGWHLAPWTQEPVLIAVLVDGHGSEVLATDSTWSTRPSAIESDLLFTGITQTVGGPKPAWEAAIEVDGPTGSLSPSTAPRVLPRSAITGVEEHILDDGARVIDFGRILAGTASLEVDGRPGEVRIKYGEYRDEAGHVVCDNVLATGEAQVDRLIVRDAVAPFAWRPEPGYKGFRWVEITGGGDLEVADVAAIPYESEIARVGSFACDEPVLDWLPTATVATLINNLHGVPTDTPVYEKNGWTADAHLVAESALFHLDLRPMLEKWLDDHVDAADDDGVVPQIVPTPGWGRRLDPAWSGSMILLPWALYWEHGDAGILRRYAEPMGRYLDRALEIAADAEWIWPLHSWGDWVTPGGAAPEGPAPVNTMVVARLSALMGRTMRILGDDLAAERYEECGRRVGEAYHARYWDEELRRYGVPGIGYRQTMNALPLAFGTVPDAVRGAVVDGLARDVLERTDGHLDCGALGSKHLLPALTDGGRLDVAITVATQTTEPGWGIAMASGDGTLWETFEHTARSRDHYFLGSVSDWIHRSVGGLQQTDAGWRRFRVAPPLDDRVHRARAAHDTPLGIASVAWSRAAGSWTLDITVPDGASGLLALPGAPERELSAGRHQLVEAVR